MILLIQEVSEQTLRGNMIERAVPWRRAGRRFTPECRGGFCRREPVPDADSHGSRWIARMRRRPSAFSWRQFSAPVPGARPRPLSSGGIEGEHPLHVPGHGHEAPPAAHLGEPAERKLTEIRAPLRGCRKPVREFVYIRRAWRSLPSGVFIRCAMASAGGGFSGAGGAVEIAPGQGG